MDMQEALLIAKDFSKDRIKFNECLECTSMFIFSAKGDRIIQPIYVNKETGSVGVFNPLRTKTPRQELETAKKTKIVS